MATDDFFRARLDGMVDPCRGLKHAYSAALIAVWATWRMCAMTLFGGLIDAQFAQQRRPLLTPS